MWFRRPLTVDKRRRLAAALAVGVDPDAAARHPHVCWPQGVVERGDGRPSGCLMRRATPGSVELAWLATPEGRAAKRLPHSGPVRVAVARAVAAIVAALHADEWIVGDLRRGNAMIALLPGRPPSVELIDSDSFWRVEHARSHAATRIEYSEGCAAPEIVATGAPPSEHTDRWALAVLIFMLLCDAAHPLAIAGAAHRTLDDAVLAGPPPPHAFADLPAPLARLCRAAFVDGYDAGEQRPAAATWHAELAALV
jgi:DNA-binding helix-hairpin-helix protein with protein kinase domain